MICIKLTHNLNPAKSNSFPSVALLKYTEEKRQQQVFEGTFAPRDITIFFIFERIAKSFIPAFLGCNSVAIEAKSQEQAIEPWRGIIGGLEQFIVADLSAGFITAGFVRVLRCSEREKRNPKERATDVDATGREMEGSEEHG